MRDNKKIIFYFNIWEKKLISVKLTILKGKIKSKKTFKELGNQKKLLVTYKKNKNKIKSG